MAKFAYVWRLERKGKGAFSGYPSLINDAYRGKYDHSCDPRRPPGPYCMSESETPLGRLFNGGEGEPYIFGFRSLKQYRAWFNQAPYRRNLAEANGKLIRYRVPKEDFVPGNYQVVFKKATAKKVGTRCPAYAD